MDSTQVMTHTRRQTLSICQARHYYRFELGLVRDIEATALRIGSAYHKGLEWINDGDDVNDAINAAAESLQDMPVEYETVRSLLAGHFWLYEGDRFEVVAAEQEFRIPLVNPDTGRASQTFVLAGKIDLIVRLPDGRLALVEYKTTSEDVGPDSSYWLRLRQDPQISLYLYAARELGYDVQVILYDATRKPSISPRQIPLLDEDGNKIVLDAAGERVFNKNGKPRQSADSKLGYEMQTREESPEEFGKRLLDDVSERPEFYYARREITRTDDDILRFRRETWLIAQQLRHCQRNDWWMRTVTAWTCNACDYAGLCLSGVVPGAGEVAPTGYTWLQDKFPELSQEDSHS